MPLWKNYYLFHSIPEALNKLMGEARLTVGGIDLLLELKKGIVSPVNTLIDFSQIPKLRVVETRNSELFIGTAVALNKEISSLFAQEFVQILVEALKLSGGTLIQKTATLGGNHPSVQQNPVRSEN
jgi:CO/xanthine dehydrogenase FAD-binding subunit